MNNPAIDLTVPIVDKNSPDLAFACNMFSPIKRERDQQLLAAVTHYSQSSPTQREAIRASIDRENHTWLLSYSHRAAVFALREKSHSLLASGLNALTMIPGGKLDPRDVMVVVSEICYVAIALKLQFPGDLSPIVHLADAEMQATLNAIIDRGPKYPFDRNMGFREIDCRWGLNLIHSDRSVFEPKVDLLELAIEIAKIIQADDWYRHVTISIGKFKPESLPNRGALWLVAQPDADAHAELRHQMFHLRLAEAENAEVLNAALPHLLVQKSQGSQFVVTHQAVVCTGWARSIVLGVADLESQQSLQRFTTAIQSLLRLHVA